jgi:serine/threonine protein phosphatase PrpC
VTSTTSWKSFGASVIGPGHIATGKPNQDAWSSFHHIWGDGIVVSDGLGSRSLSDYGSDAACRAVEQAVRRFSAQVQDAKLVAEGQYSALLADILDGWLNSIAPLDPKECSATCLFAFRLGDGLVHMGMLGDGCAAAVRHDGAVVSLSDDKTAGFSNMTGALSPSTREASWMVLDVPETECEAVVLCTDGVFDDLEDAEGFLAGFVKAYRRLARMTASRQAREMLENWPTPKHSDDKTIACLFRAEVSDE